MPCVKREYASEREARTVLNQALRQTGDKGVRPYLCPEYGHWHLGHAPGEKRAHRSPGRRHGVGRKRKPNAPWPDGVPPWKRPYR